jgi:AAA+ ATPase superfamily predicted ATPase
MPNTLKKRELFPLGKAFGDAFCNRMEETRKLTGNIQHGKHTLIIAPRRYGKSSLAERAIEQSKLPFVKINFHLCTSEEEISQIVLANVIKLIGKSIGHIEKLMSSIKKYISNLEPLLCFGGEQASLKLIPKDQPNHSVIISEALLLLEKLLAEKNKRAVIFLDEFQEIDRITKQKGIEGAFRTAAQEMQCLSLIFSGSVRSLLLSMFEDENRPLYKLCRKIKLDRIDTNDYEKHIQKIAVDTWSEPLEKDTFNKIMELSNRHPYYVNYLCDALWETCQKLPKINDVKNAWASVIEEEWSDALRELSDLPIGQRKLLKHIANNTVKTIRDHETCLILSMPASSVSTSVQVLLEKDYVEQNKQGYYGVINPLLLAVLKGAED